jgi:histidyl-tRNA synthetase
MFRGERPQKGRLREFNHIGAEAIGSNSFYLDAEIIDLAMRIITEVGVKKFKLKINSLGCVDDKKKLTKLINEKLSPKKDMLCSNCQRRVNDNPLRVIDCKNPRCQKEVKSLKLGKKHLCPECQNHFEQVLSQLDAYNIDYDYDRLLVRGLDYYTNTVFEIVSAGLGSQSAIGAGGRYNQLIASLGGTEVPAVGFALGVERMMLLLDKKYQKSPKMVSVAYTSDETKSHAYKLVHKLRINGIAATIDYCNKSLKAQLKLASKNKTPVTLIVGDQELKQNCILVRNMAESSQEKIKTKDLIKTLKEQLK